VKRTREPEYRRHAAFGVGGVHPLVGVCVSNQQISVTFAGNIGIGAIFNGAAQSNEVGYWLEAMTYTDQFEQLPLSDGEITRTLGGLPA
jgi:hypothetical protein